MSKQLDPFRVIKSLKGRNYYSLKALEENFNRIRKETEKEKIRRRTTGLAGLLPE